MTEHRQHQPTSTWEEQLRMQLSTHSAQPPADLWGAIEHDLAALEGVTPAQGRVVPLYARWAATAAVVALTAGLAWWAGSGSDGEQAMLESESGHLAAIADQQTRPAQQPQTDERGAVGETRNAEAGVHNAEAEVHNAEATTRNAISAKSNVVAEAGSTKTGGAHTHAAQTPAFAQHTAVQPPQDSPASASAALQNERAEYPSSQNEAEVGVTTPPVRGAGLIADNTTDDDAVLHHPSSEPRIMDLYLAQSNALSELLSKDYDADGPLGPGSNDYPHSSFVYWDHDLPLKTSVLVRLSLTHSLALDAGLSYTYLHSTLGHNGPKPTDNWNADQRVHYLGVPVSLSCYFYEGKRWSAYVSAGAEVDKAVSVDWQKNGGLAPLDKQDAPNDLDHPWQLSVSAAAGVQYNLSQRVGIYLQPSVGYFFDNHSRIETYYTEHPFTPSLQVGLRINVNKTATKLKEI